MGLFCSLTVACRGEEKPEVRILIFGQVDHGMDTLTAAMVRRQVGKRLANAVPLADIRKGRVSTGVQDSVKIRRSAVSYETARRKYTQVYTTTYRDTIKELIAGSQRFEGSVLVVSAADGPMPQTRTLVSLARKSGLPAPVVFLNNCELVYDPELVDLVEIEIRELLSKYGYPGDTVPVVRGSGGLALESPDDPQKTKCIDTLLDAIDAQVPDRARETPTGAQTVHASFEAEVYFLSADEGGRQRFVADGYQAQFWFGTLAVPGRMELVTEDICQPGTHVSVRGDLEEPSTLERGTRFAVKEEGRTVGVGTITRAP
jgi:translation elongation factor EF-Tu-like GTPase